MVPPEARTGSLRSVPHGCPCGYYSDPTNECTCSVPQIKRYRSKISGPLMDRIDIHIEVPSVPYKDLSTEYAGEKSEDIRARVIGARSSQLERFKGDRIYCNGQMKTRHIKKFCGLKGDAQTLIENAMHKLALSARSYTRILKLSRTIADLESSEDIQSHHISEAIQYRTLDRGQ